MNKRIMTSFKRELLVCFILVALLPLVISSCFLIEILKTTISKEYEKRIGHQLTVVDQTMVELFDGFQNLADRIANNQVIVNGIHQNNERIKNEIYQELYHETSSIREKAQVDLYDEEGICQYSTGYSPEGSKLLTYWGSLKVASTCDTVVIQSVANSKESIVLQAVQSICDQDNSVLGYIVIGMSQENFQNVLKNTYDMQNSIVVLDPYWREVYSTRIVKDEDIGTTIRSRRLAGENLKQPKDEMDFYIQQISNTGFYILLARTPIFTSDITAIMFSVILIVALLSLLGCIIMAECMSSRLTKPVKLLSDAMHKVEHGDLTQKLEVHRMDELGRLSTSFNVMTAKLKENVEHEVRQQQELNDANISMMQAQLNPHFLYNTLDTIKWVAKANSIPELATLASSLAKILRTSISENKFITLEEELKLVKYYTDIQKIRFHGKFTIDIEVATELLDCVVPKLIIQPIVENAIIHGLADRDHGHVFLNVYEKELKLYIEVSDDGCGMDQNTVNELNNGNRENMKGHIGFYNVKTIIHLYYGEEYGVLVNTVEGQGSKVIVTLPINR